MAPRFAVDMDLWAADVDTVQIGQVVHNLVLNALQAMPNGGVVDVMLQNVELDVSTSLDGTLILPGRYVRATVRDSGPGIGAEYLNRIFEPYFTTKEKGSGLGLAISYSIVKAHGGALTVESELGRGSQFSVYLPASTRNHAVETRHLVEAPRARSGRVLLMDDDLEVGDVARDMLESLGFTVQVATSGGDAIDQFRFAEASGLPFDFVILDLTVPGGMGGREAVTHIRKVRSNVPVVVTSGYADDSVLARFSDYGFDGVLPKPFAIPDLRRALEEAEASARQGLRGAQHQHAAVPTTLTRPAHAGGRVASV